MHAPIDAKSFWAELFGSTNPVEIEVGPGTGTFFLSAASANPGVNYLGIEHSTTRTTSLQKLVEARNLPNGRVIRADAGCVIPNVLPEACVQAIHVYFPDPWWKRRHHHRRLFIPAFAQAIERALIPGSYLYVATDVERVFNDIVKSAATVPTLRRDPERRSPRMGLTRFEQKGLAKGATIFDAAWYKQQRPEREFVD